MKENGLPPFVQEYRIEGAALWFNSGNPVRAGIVYHFLLNQMPSEEIASLEINSFLLLEGYLYKHEIEGDSYPTLNYYLSNRGNLDIASLWQEWGKIVDVNELSLIIKGFDATRRHALETMAALPAKEKKSE